mgnify:CR=1 FL=1
MPVTNDDPAGADEPTQPPVKPKRQPRRLWIAAALVVVLALVGSIAWVLRPQPPAGTVSAATPREAVSGFLQALADADADRALQYALNRPVDTTLLTRPVLEASRKEAPLVIVNVPEVAGNGTSVQVPAELKLGEEPFTITFSVSRTDLGWRLGQVTSTIDPGPLPSALGAALNGQPLTNTSHLEVFPGVYRFAEQLAEITFKSSRVVVSVAGEDIRAGLQPTLTTVGEKAVNKIAHAAVKACLAKKEPAPQGCPNSVKVAEGQKLSTKTIKWTLVSDPWKDAAYTLDVADPTQARGATKLTFRFRCTLTQNGEKYMVDQTNSVDVRYMLTVTDPKVAVVWQRIT